MGAENGSPERWPAASKALSQKVIEPGERAESWLRSMCPSLRSGRAGLLRQFGQMGNAGNDHLYRRFL